MKTLTNEQILNKGCEIKIGDEEYKCYNETSLMHFVKLGKDSQMLSPKNKSNLLSINKVSLVRMIKLGACSISVGQIVR